MKAAIVERPGELSVREVAEPVMGDYDCLCENLYGATCSGTDLHLIQGRAMPFPVRYPLMLGHETIGRVVKVGAKVEAFSVDDLVTRTVNRDVGDISAMWGASLSGAS